ncbi:hypothetical protein VNO77_16018 [Canavalia gladiata]|uniref:Uncharacterized protein n=1 Tax=Canavalia gladiata TaxID=3824 RepID=A0AAN9M3F5_CANGL
MARVKPPQGVKEESIGDATVQGLSKRVSVQDMGILLICWFEKRWSMSIAVLATREHRKFREKPVMLMSAQYKGF